MPSPQDGLTDAQRAAVTHRGGPLLVVGGAGTGKTTTLVARLAWLTDQGLGPERILLLVPSASAADALRRRVEEAIAGPYEELAVHTPQDFCARLLRDEALAAGVDPFTVPVSAADRLAMLLERIGELSLRSHDFRGNPAALLASFIERIDRLKGELIDAERYAAWAEGAEGAAGEEGAERAAEAAGDEGAAEAEGAAGANGAAGERQREFAEVYRAHDRMLAEAGALDAGDMLLHATRLLAERDEVRARTARRFAHVLADGYQELDLARLTLVELLAREHGGITAAGDDDQATGARPRAAAAVGSLRDFTRRHPDGRVVALERSHRCPRAVLEAARAVVEPLEDRLPKVLHGREGGAVAFWRCANERAQAQAVGADVERLVTREGVPPESIAVLVRSLRNEAQPVAVALEERAVPHRTVGAAAFFQRAEIRDVLAWLRLLADPGDAGAVVRALARAPIELRAVDLARCTQIARRRKLDMVSALVAATESPQIPPEARERILAFLKLYRAASASLDTVRPDLYVHRLIERLGLRRQQLFAAHADVVERLLNLAKLAELARAYVARAPQATAREFARYIASVAEAGLREEEALVDVHPSAVSVMPMEAAHGLQFDHVYVLGLHSARMPGARRAPVEPIPDALLREELSPDRGRADQVAEMRRLLNLAMTRARERLVLAYPAASETGAEQPASRFAEEARAALGAEWQDHEEELFGPAEGLHSTFRMLRDEVLEGLGRVGGRIGELRFDTDLDVAHAVVRYLELLKLAALIERPAGQSVVEALPELNARLLQAATPLQREVFETSALDEYLLDAERDERRRARAVAAREEPSLEAFLPRRGDGLMLSASDIETYRVCPLRYKFARVFRIPTEPTLNQRFGILVHQVLERFHGLGGAGSLAELLGLLDAGWRRGGFGDSDEELQLRGKAEAALHRYSERIREEPAEPVWFERAFAFRLGPHLLRGRVDRVDRLPDGGYELIDYKTGRPRTEAQLKDDVQLSLYAVGAREAWQLEAAHQAYYYVLDDEKVPVRRDETDREWITDTVLEVGAGIMSQGFEPTPSYAACSSCDFRIICPAAER